MELMHTDDERLETLGAYLRILKTGTASREEYDRYAEVLSSANAFEVNAAIHAALAEETDMDSWKIPVARFIRATAHTVESAPLPDYPEGHLLQTLEAENSALGEFLIILQQAARSRETLPVAAVRACLAETDPFSPHYVRLQNELFPLFELSSREHACVKLMWAIQDDILAMRKRLLDPDAIPDEKTFLRVFGEFYLNAGSLSWRERYILYPVAFRAVSPDAFAGPGRTAGSEGEPVFTSGTGVLTRAQLEAIFSVLPVDISFIGSDDRVKYYSDPPHRIFPRSPAIIGRLVQNCHPPKSVATVEKILESFKSGDEDTAEFWLTVKERFIHIRYYAVRGESGEYLGTLEVSQDVTGIRALEGEKRLL